MGMRCELVLRTFFLHMRLPVWLSHSNAYNAVGDERAAEQDGVL
jgi:hypothetical protein